MFVDSELLQNLHVAVFPNADVSFASLLFGILVFINLKTEFDIIKINFASKAKVV